MTTHLMHCFRFAALLLALVFSGASAHAHKASDAYLQLQVLPEAAQLRVDVALRDLDVALDIDADGDGRLTWAEVRAAWPSIEAYLRANIEVGGCDLGSPSRALEKRVDGVYAVLRLRGTCDASRGHAIRYTVLGEIDPTHRGLVRIDVDGQASVLRVLDPTKPVRIAAVAQSEPAPIQKFAAPVDKAGLVQEPPAAATVASEVAVNDEPHTQFLREGIHHILTGYDHVLFLLCLMLPSVMRRTPRGWRPVERVVDALLPVFGIVTAFTLAHSVSLALAAMQWVSLSPAFIEPAIAVTIVLAAVDNVRPIFGERRALVTFFFGLIHGFGFAGVLSELNLPTGEFAWALLQFNLGIELGQLTIVAAAVALLFVLRERPRYPVWIIRGGSFAAMFVGLLWFIERTANVSLLPL